MISDLKLSKINDNEIKAYIVGDFPQGAEFHFYLLRNARVLSRDGWFMSSEYSWKDLEPGHYHVRGFVRTDERKVDFFSRGIRLFPDSLAEEAAESIDSFKEEELEVIPFSTFEYPHADFVYCLSSDSLPDLQGFSQFSVSRNGKKFSLYSNIERVLGGVAFSGSAFLNDDLIFGSEDFSNIDKSDYSEFNCLVGDYAIAYFTDDKFCLSNDFFGNHKIFYFKQGGLFLASNRLHLLLILLSKLNVSVDVDHDILKAILVSGSIQPFQQLYSHDQPFKGIKLLPINTRIEAEYETGDVSFVDKEIEGFFKDASANEFSEEEYKTLILKGVDQVRRQTLAVLKHEGFDNVLVDATGGMDTRVILAAASNFPAYKNKIKVNACDTKSIPNDIKVGCALASIAGFEHDNIKETHLNMGARSRKLSIISKSLGSYFATDISNVSGFVVSRDRTININGFYGEVCLRPYYARNYLKKDGFKEMEERESLKKFLVNLTKLGSADAEGVHEKVFFSSLESLPGKSMAEKYDLMYLFFRNGFHCSDTIRPNNSTPRLGVIQSPSLFKAKRMMFHSGMGNTFLQNDFIALLNSAMLKVPYASDFDNSEFSECKGKLFNLPSGYEDIEVGLNTDGSTAVESRKEKEIKRLDGYTCDEVDLSIPALAFESINYLRSLNLIGQDLYLELYGHFSTDNNVHVAMNKAISFAQCHRVLSLGKDRVEKLVLM